MASDDWAVVVGISAYPDLAPPALNGPENDAKSVAVWLRSPTGGNVPKRQIQLILSSDYRQPFADVYSAKPTGQKVQEAIGRLHQIGRQNKDAGKPETVGRRLYLYLAGHGFAPSDDQTALLSANANRTDIGPGYHILGPYNADWFARAGYFSEIVLIMDCCRETYTAPSLNKPYGVMINRKKLDGVRRFHAFATQWSGLSRERLMADGVVRGIFTTALLAGLKGAASVSGKVTTVTLRDYLYSDMIKFLSPGDLLNPDVPKEPDIPQYGKEWDLVEAPPLQTNVTIRVPAIDVGRQVQIRGGDYQIVASGLATANGFGAPLATGSYLAEIVGGSVGSQAFKVFSADAFSVQL
jgi:Caspase domain